MIYRFRVILDNDTEDDVFRDLEIRETDTMEDLHNIITQSFGFDGMEMASFYITDDEWNQGEEIAMFDMSEAGNEVRVMNQTIIKDVVHEASPKLIYVYDFLSMWTFYVELAEIVDEAKEAAVVEADRIKTQAQAEVDRAVSQAREELREKVSELALAGAEKILEREIDGKQHEDILGKLAAEL